MINIVYCVLQSESKPPENLIDHLVWQNPTPQGIYSCIGGSEEIL